MSNNNFIESEVQKLEKVYVHIIKQYKLITEDVLERYLRKLEGERDGGSKKELPDFLMEHKVLTREHHRLVLIFQCLRLPRNSRERMVSCS